MEARYSMEGCGALPSSQASTLRSYEKNENPQCPLPPDPRLLPLGLGLPLTSACALLCPCCGSWPSHALPLALSPSTHLAWPMALLNGPRATASVPRATASVPCAAASVPHSAASVPCAAASVPPATASVPCASASLPRSTASLPSSL